MTNLYSRDIIVSFACEEGKSGSVEKTRRKGINKEYGNVFHCFFNCVFARPRLCFVRPYA